MGYSICSDKDVLEVVSLEGRDEETEIILKGLK
jgi:hypothetical protein